MFRDRPIDYRRLRLRLRTKAGVLAVETGIKVGLREE